LIIISMIFWNIPVAYRAAMAGLAQIDRSIDEAATSLGASSLRGSEIYCFLSCANQC